MDKTGVKIINDKNLRVARPLIIGFGFYFYVLEINETGPQRSACCGQKEELPVASTK